MSTVEFLTRLRDQEIEVWVEDERLRYSAAPGALSPELRAELVERKAAIIAFLRQAALAAGPSGPPLQPATRDGDLPLSFAQQRLWFLEQLEPNNTAYLIHAAVRLEGMLDRAALAASLAALVQRHEALRTTVTLSAGQPVQCIAATMELPLQLIDLSDLPAAVRERQFHRHMQVESQRAFDMALGPLVRVHLLRLAAQEHVLLLTLHHSVADGWSLGVLIREIATLYTAARTGAPLTLPPLPIQYADYAVWQRAALQGVLREQQLAYWREQLAGAPTTLELPTDHPRPPIQTYHGATQPLVLAPALVEQLVELSQQAGGTLFMTLLATFEVLLHRYSGQADLLIGSPIANRTHVATEGLIGCLINTLVLRGDLRGNPTFWELLGRVRADALGAYAHQDLPFELLVEALQPERDLSRHPLFQVMFVLHNTPRPTLQLPDLTLVPVDINTQSAAFDLTLNLEERAGALHGWLEYNTDLFESATIARMLGHYQALLVSIVANPRQPIAALEFLPAAERQQVLATWNATTRIFPGERDIPQLFEAQVAACPTATAVVATVETLSYGELNTRANQLAHQLRARGVGPETRVAVCLARSPMLLVALLGILKAGGVYVPLDPSYPRERLEFMLNDSQASVVLTSREISDRRLEIERVEQSPISDLKSQIIHLDADWPIISQQPTSNPPVVATPDNLAYAIYTSGSTGQPKGVLIPRRALANHCQALIERYTLQPEDRVLQLASISFDVAAEEIFPTLLSGGCLVLWPSAILGGPQDLVEFVERERLSVLNLPTPYWHAWVAELKRTALIWPAALRLVIVGSDTTLADRLIDWRRLVGDRGRWINAYGPTEATITATLYEPDAERTRCSSATAVPIGRPIANVQVYLLDAGLRPVPIGVPGEIHIGGAGMARGYLNLPALTAERFTPDPFSGIPGARLYKTGDLARFLPEGIIEYLGRTDHQCKVRGFRIELGEIEAVLAQHPQVREVVVLVSEDVPGDKRLVAYIASSQLSVVSGPLQPTTDNGQRTTDNGQLTIELRAFLRDKLPAYMIPSVFVALEMLPRTPTGKVDRRALPMSAQLRSEAQAAYVAPRTELERGIAQVWQEALQIERCGVDDNFFDLGGHSLLLVQVHSRLRETLGAELALIELFEHPSISTLAKHIRQQHQGQRSTQPEAGRFEQARAGKSRLQQRLSQRQRAEDEG